MDCFPFSFENCFPGFMRKMLRVTQVFIAKTVSPIKYFLKPCKLDYTLICKILL